MMVMQTAAIALSSLVILAVPRLIHVSGHRCWQNSSSIQISPSENAFADQLIESTIGREKKNQSSLHWIPPGEGNWSVAAPGELEVSATSDTHLHCSPPLLQDVECGVLMEPALVSYPLRGIAALP